MYCQFILNTTHSAQITRMLYIIALVVLAFAQFMAYHDMDVFRRRMDRLSHRHYRELNDRIDAMNRYIDHTNRRISGVLARDRRLRKRQAIAQWASTDMTTDVTTDAVSTDVATDVTTDAATDVASNNVTTDMTAYELANDMW